MFENMSASREHVLQQALALAPKDRAFVAEALDTTPSAHNFSVPAAMSKLTVACRIADCEDKKAGSRRL